MEPVLSSVSVDSFSEREVEGSRFVVYHIKVQPEHGENWTISRRWNDVKELEQNLNSEKELFVPKLPTDLLAFMRKFDKEFLSGRKQFLQKYLSALIAQLPHSTLALVRFFKNDAVSVPFTLDQDTAMNMPLQNAQAPATNKAPVASTGSHARISFTPALAGSVKMSMVTNQDGDVKVNMVVGQETAAANPKANAAQLPMKTGSMKRRVSSMCNLTQLAQEAEEAEEEKPQLQDKKTGLSAMRRCQSMNEIVDKLHCCNTMVREYSHTDLNALNTVDYRRFINADGEQISFWHDVSLLGPRGGFNAVIEITQGTTAKFEMDTTSYNTPIKQDLKKGKLRHYNMPICWNYGAFPQTWEQPEHEWEGLEGHAGDNDPLDIVDLGSEPVSCGAVVEVKPIAALAMIDEGEVDWKVIVVNLDDPRAAMVDSIEDCEKYFPGQIAAVRDWFTWYKAKDKDGNRIPGAEPNVFGFDGRPLDTEKTLNVIMEAHSTWDALVHRRVPKPNKLVLA